MQHNLALSSVMTADPHFVSADDSLSRVQEVMEDHNFRHLPVLMGEQIVGIISDRDVSLALSLSPPREQGDLTAADICTPEPYTVDINERFEDVLLYMGETKIGSVIVTEQSKMVGIITTTDVCRVCGEFLKTYYQTLS